MTAITTQELKDLVDELDYRGLQEQHGRVKGQAIYHERTSALEAQWREHLREDNAPTHWTTEQFDVVFRQAWADGHASGYSEVENCLWDIVQLIEDFERAGQ